VWWAVSLGDKLELYSVHSHQCCTGHQISV